jgi:capsid protein
MVKISEEMANKAVTAIRNFLGLDAPVKPQPKSDFNGGGYTNIFSVSYNGEKNLGEIGPIINYSPDYQGLRMRSWQSYYESEITQTVINRFSTWVIGKGLKLQSEPEKVVLENNGITLDFQKFSDDIEAWFNVYRKSKLSDYSNMRSLNKNAMIAFKNSILGGDVLVVLRYIDGVLKIQLIDGCHIQSPAYGTESYPAQLADGNVIKNGIEMSPTGEHVRYWVRQKDYSFKSIDAKSKKTDLQLAFLVYGSEYRLDNVRGLPLVATVLETLKKLERYKEATVGSAEERQKISLFIEHALGSSGENPFNKQLAKAMDYDANSDTPRDINGTELANLVAASTNKVAVNLPTGATMNSLESKNELYFKDFYTVNINLVCAALGIPPEVAMSKYDSNFSASRAALKDWEHTLNVKRDDFSEQFYKPIFNFFLEVSVLENKIQAPGYLTAKISGNKFLIEAYRNARFVGTPVPHIDPLKEVNAERAKLGELGAHLPLTTLEAATEALNGGEAKANIIQFGKENELAEANGLEPKETAEPATKETKKEEEE